jgi:hypothetical protein
LLIPANLLADGSVLNRALPVLTAVVCQDVEVIGWLYQFYISERKDEVFAGFKKNQRAGASEIPAATQLFTPHWIVRYLVENSLGRLWMLNRPNSRLVDQMEYYISPVDAETDFLKINNPEELKVIDPACGSGHMLTYAFDLLYSIYEEEGYAPTDIPGLILTNNLFGTEIDTRAGALAAFALTMKSRSRQRTFFNGRIAPNICVLEPIVFSPAELDLLLTPDGDTSAEAKFWNQFQHADTFGALIQPLDALIEPLRLQLDTRSGDDRDLITSDLLDRARKVVDQAEYLTCRYHVVVANPPYMVAANMDTRLNHFVKAVFPDSKADLFSTFIDRNLDLSVIGGWVAMITMQSWMFLPSFLNLRKRVIEQFELSSMAHLGINAFDTMNSKVLSTTAFVIRARRASRHAVGIYLRLIDGQNESIKANELRRAATGVDANNLYRLRNADLAALPGSIIAYWLSDHFLRAFKEFPPLSEFVPTREGLTTGDNDKFLRRWYEVGSSSARDWATDSVSANRRWFPYLKGGEYRLWWGNLEYVVDWQRDGERQRQNIDLMTGRVRSHNYNGEFAFRPGFTWTGLSSGGFSGRIVPSGFMFDAKAPMAFPAGSEQIKALLAILNSSTGAEFLKILAPTLDFKLGTVMSTPAPGRTSASLILDGIQVDKLVAASRADWDDFETSWNFGAPSWLASKDCGASATLEESMAQWSVARADIATEQAKLETENNRIVAEAYGLAEEVEAVVPLHRVTLTRNVHFRYGPGRTAAHYARLERADVASELVSYAVGCMLGRYSLDVRGLILADQGATLQEYLARVSNPTFVPDVDNVIPVVDGDWFEDDIVARFRQFIRSAFGEQHFEENLRFVTDALEVKDLRVYFVKSFYRDHVQRYKKRPIYWLFSSPKGSFNALIYMHRYTSSTVSTVLNEYLREYKAKLGSSLQHYERLAVGGGTPREQGAAQKEADRLRKVLLELDEYEHDVLYPLASQQVEIDLDDGVRVNYPKFGAALKKIPGLEAAE